MLVVYPQRYTHYYNTIKCSSLSLIIVRNAIVETYISSVGKRWTPLKSEMSILQG